MPWRIRQFLLIAGLAWASWLCMMLVHECGHVIGALATGGHVNRMVWYPLFFSRTDVQPNPSPRVEIWAGPVFGSVIPVLIYGLASLLKLRRAYMVGFFASVCLLANGLYIGVGSVSPVGDAKQLLQLGEPRLLLIVFGVGAAGSGLWILNSVSGGLGFGKDSRSRTVERDWSLALLIAAVVTVIGFIFGNRGA